MYIVLESAVEDLSKLDGELSKLSSAFETSNDSLELSHLIHAFSHRLCRTLETCKGACNRAPPEQGDGIILRLTIIFLKFNFMFYESDGSQLELLSTYHICQTRK